MFLSVTAIVVCCQGKAPPLSFFLSASLILSFLQENIIEDKLYNAGHQARQNLNFSTFRKILIEYLDALWWI